MQSSMQLVHVSIRDRRLRKYLFMILTEFWLLGLSSILLALFDKFYILEINKKVVWGAIFSYIPWLLRRSYYLLSWRNIRNIIQLALQKDTFYLTYVTIWKEYQGRWYAHILIQKLLLYNKKLYFSPSQKWLEWLYAKHGAIFYRTYQWTTLPWTVWNIMIFNKR